MQLGNRLGSGPRMGRTQQSAQLRGSEEASRVGGRGVTVDATCAEDAELQPQEEHQPTGRPSPPGTPAELLSQGL